MTKLRDEIEPKIEQAQALFSKIVKSLEDYTKYMEQHGDVEFKEFQRLIQQLSALTGKDITSEKYNIPEYWEADGLAMESFRIALPDPLKINKLERQEIEEIVRRIVDFEVPGYLINAFIQENGFEPAIIDYYHAFLQLNLTHYQYQLFNRRKDKAGNWSDPTVTSIVDYLIAG